MHVSVHHWIQHYGFWGVFVVLLLEMVGVPFPAETTLTFLGIQWDKGGIAALPYLLAAAAGNIAGSSVAYAIGWGLGRTVILRYGKWVKITPDRLDRAEHTFRKYGYRLIAVAKFIAGIRVLVPYLAGINRVPFARFTLVNSISALVWVAVFMILGKYLGVMWFHYVKNIHHILIPALCLLILAAIGYFLWKKNRARRPVD